jgi:hypothetical protein
MARDAFALLLGSDPRPLIDEQIPEAAVQILKFQAENRKLARPPGFEPGTLGLEGIESVMPRRL